MITLSERAARQIEAMHRDSAAAGQLLRVFVETGGCSGFQYGMSFDAPKEGDEQLESSGVRFLIDAASHAYMEGSNIDFDDGLQGKGFEIQNPNAQSTCGCGKSFN